jgi:hypothetical protein
MTVYGKKYAFENHPEVLLLSGDEDTVKNF